MVLYYPIFIYKDLGMLNSIISLSLNSNNILLNIDQLYQQNQNYINGEANPTHELVLVIPPLTMEKFFSTSSSIKLFAADYAYCIIASKQLYTWGSSFLSNIEAVDKPLKIEGLTGIIDVAIGSFHALALSENGKAWITGGNLFGQQGTTFDNPVFTPFEIPGAPHKKIKQI